MATTFSPVSPRRRDAIDMFEEARRTRDAHRTATVFALLVFIWGGVSLLATPWEPFWLANVPQTIVSAAAIPYFLRSWKHPNRRIAEAFTALVVVYALCLLPWTSYVWTRMGRPVEAFTVPELAVICMALLLPPPMWLRIAVMSLFAAVGVFAWVDAHRLGLDTRIPVTEPIALIAFFFLGVGICLLRRNRRELVRDYVGIQAEVQALDHVRPMFSHARDQLRTQLDVLAADISDREESERVSQGVVRALDRLSELRSRLDDVTSEDQSGLSADEAEQRVLARDAQLGATFLAGIAVILVGPTLMWSHFVLSRLSTELLAANALSYCALLIYLVATRRHPSSRRAMWAILALVATTLPVAAYNQMVLLHTHQPYAPFLGHKLLMVSLGLTVASRFKLGVFLIAITVLSAMGLWFVLGIGEHRDVVPLAEPWITLSFALIGLVSARILDNRRAASVRLLRAEAEASALYRRALLLLALRDRLNTPLQTLILGMSPISPVPGKRTEEVETAVEHLIDLSHELGNLDWVVPLAARHTSLDADGELRRR